MCLKLTFQFVLTFKVTLQCNEYRYKFHFAVTFKVTLQCNKCKMEF